MGSMGRSTQCSSVLAFFGSCILRFLRSCVLSFFGSCVLSFLSVSILERPNGANVHGAHARKVQSSLVLAFFDS